jgi:hypothetical protein
VGDSAETAYQNEMYVTPKVVDRWKEVHWLCISTRCWKCTYGPDTKAWAHIHESKGADGTPWPEWAGLQSYENHSNRTREEARERPGRGITAPDYTQLVNAMVGERISIATEMAMACTCPSTFAWATRYRRRSAGR